MDDQSRAAAYLARRAPKVRTCWVCGYTPQYQQMADLIHVWRDCFLLKGMAQQYRSGKTVRQVVAYYAGEGSEKWSPMLDSPTYSMVRTRLARAGVLRRRGARRSIDRLIAV
jgi:hypothetical protein